MFSLTQLIQEILTSLSKFNNNMLSSDIQVIDYQGNRANIDVLKTWFSLDHMTYVFENVLPELPHKVLTNLVLMWISFDVAVGNFFMVIEKFLQVVTHHGSFKNDKFLLDTKA